MRPVILLWCLATAGAIAGTMAVLAMRVLAVRVQQQGVEIAQLQHTVQILQHQDRTGRPAALRVVAPNDPLYEALAELQDAHGEDWLDEVAATVVELGGSDAADDLHEALDRAVDAPEPIDPLGQVYDL